MVQRVPGLIWRITTGSCETSTVKSAEFSFPNTPYAWSGLSSEKTTAELTISNVLMECIHTFEFVGEVAHMRYIPCADWQPVVSCNGMSILKIAVDVFQYECAKLSVRL